MVKMLPDGTLVVNVNMVSRDRICTLFQFVNTLVQFRVVRLAGLWQK